MEGKNATVCVRKWTWKEKTMVCLRKKGKKRATLCVRKWNRREKSNIVCKERERKERKPIVCMEVELQERKPVIQRCLYGGGLKGRVLRCV